MRRSTSGTTRQLAAERLEPGAHGYYAGGAGDELTLRDNVEAFQRWQLRPRMLVDVDTCTTATTVLGQEVSMPLLVAPVAFQRVAHPDGEVGDGARGEGGRDDHVPLDDRDVDAGGDRGDGVPRWFQLYVFRDEGVTRELIAQARDRGFTALVLTIDTPFLGNGESAISAPDSDPADYHGRRRSGRAGSLPPRTFAIISRVA